MSKSIFEQKLRIITELLCRGITDTSFLSISYRGAGPSGIYIEFPDKSLLSVPLVKESAQSCPIKIKLNSSDNSFNLSSLNPEFPDWECKILSYPLYDSEFTTEGIPIRKIARIHGRMLASTINQTCCYWRGQKQCKFCTIENSLLNHVTIEQKNGMQILEALKTAKRTIPDLPSHITFTIGSQFDESKVLDYIPIIHSIKQYDSAFQIHIQTEPLQNINFLKELHNAGADTIGIHIEIFDDLRRNEICPGKSRKTRIDYIRNWDEAIKFFGENQVDSYILLGLESEESKFISNCSSKGFVNFWSHVFHGFKAKFELSFGKN